MTRRDMYAFSILIIVFIALCSAGVSSGDYTSGHDARYFSSAAAGSLMWADDFGDGDASDWLVIEGNWTVIDSAYKGEHTADGRSVAGDISWTNYRYDGVFMFDILNYYEATVLFRVQDAGVGPNVGHYYEFANYVGLDEVALWHISNGAADLVTVPYTFETGVWYQFALEVWGSSVRYYINEMLVIQYDQLNHYNQGRIGVKSFISAAWFDDLRVTSIDEPTGIPGGPAQPSPALANFTNRPNPFRSTTTISFDLESPGQVGLHVYDVTGRRIRTLLYSPVAGGPFSIEWDGRNSAGRIAASGVYFCRVETEHGPFTRKMIKVH